MKQDAWVRVIDDTAPDLLAYFRRRLPAEDAADAVAEVMAIAWRRRGAVPEDPHQARMWLFGVARNVLLQSMRSTIRQRELSARLRSFGAFAAPPADEGSDVRDALDRLTPDHAEILRLVHWDGFSLTDAAAHLGIVDSTARSRYQRAKEALRWQLSITADRP